MSGTLGTVKGLSERLQDFKPMTEKEINFWIYSTEPIRSNIFFVPDVETAKQYVRHIADVLVTKFLNNPDESQVPLDHKTRYILILSNFCLYKPVRCCIYDVLDKIGGILEESIRTDGLRPFNPELGRMSEHVLVLLMRVTGYKLKASFVHEFSENNTQFAVQLLLAILLKEPSYEVALRCNTLTAILGFTQPQAFFDGSATVQDASCEDFTMKVNFILSLMLRLKATQVISDDLTSQLENSPEVTPLLHVSICSTMRFVMNIFRFSTENSLQWRQHILLSTSIVESAVSPYLYKRSHELRQCLEANPPAIMTDLVQSMILAFNFWSLCTFRMGHLGRDSRFFCPFISELLQCSIRPLVYDPIASNALMQIYVAMFHCMATIDALSDKKIKRDRLLQQLHSEPLRKSLEEFLHREVAPCGVPFIKAWHKQLRQVGTDTLVDRDSETFAFIERLFDQMESAGVVPPTAPAPAPSRAVNTETGKQLLQDLPPLMRSNVQEEKVSIENAAAPVDTTQLIRVVRKDVIDGVDQTLLCALTGNVMKNPVLSPYGHTFERGAILAWLKQNGSICPITGKELTEGSLKPNREIATKIMKQVIQQSMAAYNQEDQADLYDF